MRSFIHATLAAATLSLAGITAAGAQPAYWLNEWPNTDFDKSSVAFSSIMSGGPPKDGIPAVDDPQFIPVAKETRLGAREPVVTLELPGRRPRAYPVRYLMWHEIVNDVIDGRKISVTYCPLCNTAIVFDGQFNGQPLTFGTTGKLRNSDLVMYDRQSESWWQQATGTGIVGAHTGDKLTKLVSWMESWAEFRTRNPKGLVMDQPSTNRPYGSNPYVGYDGAPKPFLYNGEMPPKGISPLMRVVAVGNRAWPMDRLRREGTIHEAGLVISWTKGQASALDSRSIKDGKEVGSVRVRDGNGKDVLHDVEFAFAFQAFHPKGDWMTGQ